MRSVRNATPARRLGGCAIVLLSVFGMAGCANGPASREATAPTPTSATTLTTRAPTIPTTTTTTTSTLPCPLSSATGTVPVNAVCPGSGSPHFATPDSAMAFLATAWNTGNVQDLDYVTDPAGRQQMDSMAALMVNLKFDYCSANPAGDYTCYFTHDIAPSDSSTTYPDPSNYPPGEAVFTVAPADTPGWYLTQVIHCG